MLETLRCYFNEEVNLVLPTESIFNLIDCLIDLLCKLTKIAYSHSSLSEYKKHAVHNNKKTS